MALDNVITLRLPKQNCSPGSPRLPPSHKTPAPQCLRSSADIEGAVLMEEPKSLNGKSERELRLSGLESCALASLFFPLPLSLSPPLSACRALLAARKSASVLLRTATCLTADASERTARRYKRQRRMNQTRVL
ncbi:hypothetical protein QQF64_019190 [Cirrhinus molitorella]|uniref:Uncharacterized protein n=1 Tax=Cirrhinus molitorella TaxID=172907 RepID=A0ABR3LI46_9TELE